MASSLLLLSLTAAISGAAGARQLLQAYGYSGPPSFTFQDTDPTHTADQCVADYAASFPLSSGLCVPVTVTLPTTPASRFQDAFYHFSLPDGNNVWFGDVQADGTMGPMDLVLPWGTYDLYLNIVGGCYGQVTAGITFNIIGLQEISTGLPNQNAQATDAKYGVPSSVGLRWAWFALQANNSQYSPAVAQPWYTGSSTHYHLHAYWQLTLDPLRKGATKKVSLVKVNLPYLAGGAPDYSGDLLQMYPTRTTDHNLQVSVGNNPFYGGVRTPCTLVGSGRFAAELIYSCPPAVASKYVVVTAQQAVNTTALPANATADEYATRLALHFVQVYGAYIPTYTDPNP